MKLSKLLEQQLALQIGKNELEEIFLDGKPHEMTYINAIFVDGKSLTAPALESVVFVKEVSTAKEFDDEVMRVVDIHAAAYKQAYDDQTIVYKAAFRAGAVMLMSLAHQDMDSYQDAARFMAKIVGAALAIQNVEALALHHGPLVAECHQYIAETQASWEEYSSSIGQEASNG